MSYASLIPRQALARVLQSLIAATLNAARGRTQRKGEDHGLHPWPEALNLGEGPSSLGCDSLELLWISAAVNEMFHLHEAGLEAELLRIKSFGAWLDAIESAWASGVQTLTFSTSGSTGVPKLCSHSFSNLALEVTYLTDLFACAKRVMSCVPAHHLYGFLFTTMLPERLGIPVLTGLQHGLFPPSKLISGDLIVAVPELWGWLNQTVHLWPTAVHGVTSGGPCPRALLVSLADRGLSTMIEIYGSSETAGIGVRRWPETRYRLMPQWVRQGQDSPACSLLHVSGFRSVVSDELQWSLDGTFDVLRRLDGAVQIGGSNVHPGQIAAKLKKLNGVASAKVNLMQDTDAKRLEAHIVLETGADEDAIRRDLEMWSNENLVPVEQPKRYTFQH